MTLANSELEIHPGNIYVIKRNGTRVDFDAAKIITAIEKVYIDVDGAEVAKTEHEQDEIHALAATVEETLRRRLNNSGAIHIEEIQDMVELNLMRNSRYHIAKAYVIYRQKRNEERALSIPKEVPSFASQCEEFFKSTLRQCNPNSELDLEDVISQANMGVYSGITEAEAFDLLTMALRTKFEEGLEYSHLAADVSYLNHRAQVVKYFNVDANKQDSSLLPIYLEKAVALKRINPLLLSKFDLAKLQQTMDDAMGTTGKFTYLSYQTLYDRYFVCDGDVRIELPQIMFMRVAMGLSILEPNPTKAAIDFYHVLSNFDFMSSTPTLFNAGTLHSQLSSCYLTTIPDSLYGIYTSFRDNAMLSKFAGGIGNDWTQVRALGAHIKDTNGKSQGVVPFLKVNNDTAVAVNQGGKRKGAICAYLESWHLDIEEFLELRKNTGDDRRRTHDMNTANWIPDLFMVRMLTNEKWTLFSPHQVRDLHDLYGKAFTERYEYYEANAEELGITVKTIMAADLWRKMLSMVFETGHPWLTWKDPCNIRSPQQHVGVVHSSNLCTEITLNTSKDEIAVCNLGSINLVQHIKDGKLDHLKLRKTITTAIRMLDNVVDINFYPVMEARNSNLRHRPIGLGIMGYQDALYELRIPTASQEAIEFADQSMEVISYYAIEASHNLSKERGSYESFEGSLWSKGILPIDSIELLKAQRAEGHCLMDTSTTLDWTEMRKLARSGMRNSNVMAIAPTATISNICGVTQSIEPTYQNLFVKSNLSGEFTVINTYLIADLKQAGLWNAKTVMDLKIHDGALKNLDYIPDEIKALHSTAFEIEPRWLIEAASRRQKWIDQSLSLNLYIANVSGKRLDQTYRNAWLFGLKTTYYLRALGATSAEKSSVNTNNLNAVKAVPTPEVPVVSPATEFNINIEDGNAVPAACSIDNPDCEACQ